MNLDDDDLVALMSKMARRIAVRDSATCIKRRSWPPRRAVRSGVSVSPPPPYRNAILAVATAVVAVVSVALLR
jgi:hypothetical protein